MSTPIIPATAPVRFMQAERLRAEAAIEPDPVPSGTVKKDTQIIAIYGKGGIGKSFTLANLSYMRAQQGKSEVAAFFERHGIAFRPHAAKALRGSQVHCQSGYCPYVCEGRFIEESAEVGRIVTDAGNVFADIVILAAFSKAL